MGDAADMLGIMGKGPKGLSAAEEAAKLMLGKPKLSTILDKKGKKPKGMKREVFDLIGSTSTTTAVQAAPQLKSASFKSKRVLGTEGKWSWAAIESSARNDGFKNMHHWVRADKFYSDYPYAQFNVKPEKVVYTDEHYTQHLQQTGWSREDTDTLMDYCYSYDLRWSVIADRIELSVPKTYEELQARYCFIASTLANITPSTYASYTAVQPFKVAKFDLDVETSRRKRQEHLMTRTRDEEKEEVKLREELKHVNEQIRKIKKAAKAAAMVAVKRESASSKMDIADETQLVPLSGEAKAAYQYLEDGKAILEATTTAPLLTANAEAKTLGPQPGRPCLQSSRLYLTSTPPGIGTSAVIKMHDYLRELHIPERPVPTSRVCDLVDAVRYDTQVLVALHNIIKRKERKLNGEEKQGFDEVMPATLPATSTIKASVKSEKSEKNPKPKAPRIRHPKPPAVKTEVATNFLTSSSSTMVNKATTDNLVDLLDVFSPAVGEDIATDLGEVPSNVMMTSIAPPPVLSGFTGSMMIQPRAPTVVKKNRGKKPMA